MISLSLSKLKYWVLFNLSLRILDENLHKLLKQNHFKKNYFLKGGYLLTTKKQVKENQEWQRYDIHIKKGGKKKTKKNTSGTLAKRGNEQKYVGSMLCNTGCGEINGTNSGRWIYRIGRSKGCISIDDSAKVVVWIKTVWSKLFNFLHKKKNKQTRDVMGIILVNSNATNNILNIELAGGYEHISTVYELQTPSIEQLE
ncbi:hypothetical protein RFI_27495, partial [Reticulomyxa filosa]